MPYDERWHTAYLWSPEHKFDQEPLAPILLTQLGRPAELNNPAAWFGLVPAPAIDLDDDHQFLHDAVILCVAHHQAHKDDNGARRTIPPGDYQGTHFMMWGFVADLEKKLTDIMVIEAWDGVQEAPRQSRAPEQHEPKGLPLPALLREFARECDAWERSEHTTKGRASDFLEATASIFSDVIDRLRCCHDDPGANMVEAKYHVVRDWLRSHADSPTMALHSCLSMSELTGFCRNLADCHEQGEQPKPAPVVPAALQGADEQRRLPDETRTIGRTPRPDGDEERVWADIPDEYRDAIRPYESEAGAARKKGKRIKIEPFCRQHGRMDEKLFRAYREQVRSRKNRAQGKRYRRRS